MPEIRNEIPSDQELADYFEESLKSSSIALLDDYPANQTHYHPDLVQAMRYLSSRPISAQFLWDVRRAIFLSLQRLNQLPRTDSFWENTNRRPTVFKLGEFCKKILSGEPADVPSLLTITAMVIYRTGEFQRGCWSQLRAQNAVSLEWIVFAAMFMEVCGADDTSDFSEFIRSTGAKEAIIPLLEEIGLSGGRATVRVEPQDSGSVGEGLGLCSDSGLRPNRTGPV